MAKNNEEILFQMARFRLRLEDDLRETISRRTTARLDGSISQLETVLLQTRQLKSSIYSTNADPRHSLAGDFWCLAISGMIERGELDLRSALRVISGRAVEKYGMNKIKLIRALQLAEIANSLYSTQIAMLQELGDYDV